MHWEALTARLFFDFEATLFDVWDNRQLSGLKNFLRQLEPLVNEFNVSTAKKQQATHLIKYISRVESFDQLYKLLSFTYALDLSGISNNFKHNSFSGLLIPGELLKVLRFQLIMPGLPESCFNLCAPRKLLPCASHRGIHLQLSSDIGDEIPRSQSTPCRDTRPDVSTY